MIHSVPETTSVALSVGQGVRDRSGAKANSESTNVQEKKSALQLASPSEDRKDASGTQAALGTQGATATKDAVASSQDLKDKVAQIQSKIDQIDSKVKFSVEEDLDRVIVKVVERESGELIRQIPSEEVLQAQRFFEEHSGILLEEEA